MISEQFPYSGRCQNRPAAMSVCLSLSLCISLALAISAPAPSRASPPTNNKEVIQYKNISIERYPQRFRPLIRRGDNFKQDEEFSKAVDCYSEAIKQCSNIGLFYSKRASAYELLKKPALALADWNKVIALDPNGPNFVCRGRAYDNLGQDKEALKDYLNAIAHGSKSANKDAARIYKRTGQYEKFVAAISSYIMVMRPLERIPFYFDRATGYDKLGKTALAEQDRKIANQLLNQSGAENMDKYPNVVRPKN